MNISVQVKAFFVTVRQLSITGVTLVVGAMKIDGGTGGPARVLALVGDPQALGGAASLDNCVSLTLAALLLIAGVHY